MSLKSSCSFSFWSLLIELALGCLVMGAGLKGTGYPSGGQPLHGLGLANKTCLLPSLTEIPAAISERLKTLSLPLVGKQFATLFSAYAPCLCTLPSGEEVKDAGWGPPQSSEEQQKLGDLNARVWKKNEVWCSSGSCHMHHKWLFWAPPTQDTGSWL